jgi:transposase
MARSRTERLSRVERARILLAYAAGQCVSVIAREMHTNRPRVERCIDKALQMGVLVSLDDLPRKGREPSIPVEARAWVVSLATQKPKDLGYSYEFWTTRLLAEHVRRHCETQGHPSLRKLARGTVTKILKEHPVRPHKVEYYLERRDPDFEPKMRQVLHVYKQVELLKASGEAGDDLVAYLSFDEKPGIQALENLAPDRPPIPGEHPAWSRDHQYRRHGTLTLMAGIDLLTGYVHGLVVDRHRSREFIAFLQRLDAYYPEDTRLRVVLDNHSAHTSQETRRYLSTVPNRFDFIFTPTHGSWLNLIEAFFGKMAKTMLRGIRVRSKAELVERLGQYLDEINQAPVVFRWRYKLDEVTAA